MLFRFACRLVVVLCRCWWFVVFWCFLCKCFLDLLCCAWVLVFLCILLLLLCVLGFEVVVVYLVAACLCFNWLLMLDGLYILFVYGVRITCALLCLIMVCLFMCSLLGCLLCFVRLLDVVLLFWWGLI